MRNLTVGHQCENEFLTGSPATGYVKTRCQTRHNDRSQGAPKQLISVKQGRVERFVCTECAGKLQGLPQRRGRAPKVARPEQTNLLGGD